MSRILVTGGAGFIGSHVARDLIEEGGHDVVVLDDLSGGFRNNVPDRARWVEGSILDPTLLERLFAENRFDYVFHLAAYAAEGLSHFIKHFNYENNLIGSIHLINQSILHRVKTFVFTSSIAVYGANQVPMREEMTPTPEDPYGIAKLAVELELQSSQRMFDLPYIVFRPHNVYGENQNIGDRYRNVIGIFMNQILQGKPMTVFGSGEQVRAFSYIGDVAPVIANSIDVPAARNQVFNVGADTPYSVNDLAIEVAKAFDKDLDIEHLPARNEVENAYASHEKAASILGMRPATSLEEGIRKMAVWAKQHGARKSKRFENIEIRRNLPPSWEPDDGA